MKWNDSGIFAALAAAVLFGAGTPLAKLLLEYAGPWLLAALLYLGSGIGLWIVRCIRRAPTVQLGISDWHWLLGAIVSGGVVGPTLLMLGLSAMPASGASLLLNAEGVFTALLAWFVFKENFDRRIALGMFAIVAGAVILSWPAQGAVEFSSFWPALAVLGACLAWSLDNNLTRKVALSDASWIAMVKGLMAGTTNLILAMSMGATWPGIGPALGAALVGFLSYGASLTMFVIALRHLGTARTGAYFSVAPFFGALMALALLPEPITAALLMGGALMAVGVALHLTERHLHEHTHEPLEHTHTHTHGMGDEHHVHEHGELMPAATRHSHPHQHLSTTHAHPHFPDAHHQHRH
jgi:drug/metabolite transporter (DMT)-like permease